MDFDEFEKRREAIGNMRGKLFAISSASQSSPSVAKFSRRDAHRGVRLVNSRLINIHCYFSVLEMETAN